MMNMLEAVFQRTDENKSKMKTFSLWLSLASFLLPWRLLLSMGEPNAICHPRAPEQQRLPSKSL